MIYIKQADFFALEKRHIPKNVHIYIIVKVENTLFIKIHLNVKTSFSLYQTKLRLSSHTFFVCVKSFIISPAMISPATDGENAVLPGV